MRRIVMTIFCLAAIMLSACGGGDGAGSNPVPNDDDKNKITELEGTWISNCIALDGENAGTYVVATSTFSGNTFSDSGKFYSDSTCTTVDETKSYSDSGTFVIGNSLTTGSGLAAKEINSTTLKENGVVVNNTEYDIFRIDNGTLYYGLNTFEQDGSSADKRPLELGSDEYYKPRNITELEGTWISNCIALDGENAGTYAIATSTFSGNTFSSSGKFYSDSTCATVDETKSYSDSGTFVIGNSLTTDSGLAAKEINSTTLKENGAVVNDTEYDIFRIDNGTLYYGLNTFEQDGTSADKRPLELDPDVSYTKPSNITELEGWWRNTCEDAGSGIHARGSITFSGNTFSHYVTFYSDSTCTTVDETKSYSSSGMFVIGDSLTTSSGLAAKELDITTLNENGILVKNTEYDIFSNLEGWLYFGLNTAEKDGTTAANRPVDLDFGMYYIEYLLK